MTEHVRQLLLVVALASSSAGGATIENDHIRVAIDAGRGGAVVRMDHKKAPTVPLIRDKGAHVAGLGRFFVPVLRIGGQRVDLARVGMKAAAGATARRRPDRGAHLRDRPG